MNRNKAHLARHDLAKATCGKDAQDAMLDFIDAILEEPSNPELEELEELEELKAEAEGLRLTIRTQQDTISTQWHDNRELTSQVEGLTVERDAARVGLQNKIEEVKRLTAIAVQNQKYIVWLGEEKRKAEAALDANKRHSALMEQMQRDLDSAAIRMNAAETGNAELAQKLADAARLRDYEATMSGRELAAITAERDALKARIDGAPKVWLTDAKTIIWPHYAVTDHSNCCKPVRLVPDPEPGDAPVTTSDGQVIGSYRITTSGEVPHA